MNRKLLLQAGSLIFGFIPAAGWTAFTSLVVYRSFQDLPKDHWPWAFVAAVAICVSGCIGLGLAPFFRATSLIIVLLAVGILGAGSAGIVLLFIWPWAAVSLFVPAVVGLVHIVSANKSAQRL